NDTEVTRHVGWPSHQSIEQTKALLAFSDTEWNRWPAGPYLIERQGDGNLLGGTGLAFETPTVAATEDVLARDACEHGYAAEAVDAIVVWPATWESNDCMRFVIRIIRRRSAFWRNAALCLRASQQDSRTFQTSALGNLRIACATL